MAKCFEETCRKIIQPKLVDIQCGFRPGRSTTDQILKKPWQHVKDVCTCFIDLRKQTTGFLVKIFGECCRSTVLTAACYWPSSHCIRTQMFVSVKIELNHNRSPLVLDSDKGVCCHQSLQTKFSHSSNFSRNFGKIPKTSMHVSPTFFRHIHTADRC